jgi:hypothetical protein
LGIWHWATTGGQQWPPACGRYLLSYLLLILGLAPWLFGTPNLQTDAFLIFLAFARQTNIQPSQLAEPAAWTTSGLQRLPYEIVAYIVRDFTLEEIFSMSLSSCRFQHLAHLSMPYYNALVELTKTGTCVRMSLLITRRVAQCHYAATRKQFRQDVSYCVHRFHCTLCFARSVHCILMSSKVRGAMQRMCCTALLCLGDPVATTGASLTIQRLKVTSLNILYSRIVGGAFGF